MSDLPDLSKLSTFQMAFAAGMSIKGLCQKNTPAGRFYFVKLDGVEMLASDARKILENHIIAKQRAAGLC